MGGNGATLSIEGQEDSAPGVSSAEGCRAACLEVDDCEGIVMSSSKSTVTAFQCFRKGGIDVAECQTDPDFNLYTVSGVQRPPPPPAAPSSPPPPPMQPTRSVQQIHQDLNDRWRNGGESNSLAEVGVLIHMFDNLEDWASGRGYAPCSSGWCAGRANHMSCSIINARLQKVFNGGSGGVILSPLVAKIDCAYGGDGGTQNAAGNGCIDYLCTEENWFHMGCAWPPERIGGMITVMQEHKSYDYNEVIVSSKYWDDHLPHMVEAMISGGDGKASEAHRAFLALYPERPIPLVSYRPGNFEMPFELIA